MQPASQPTNSSQRYVFCIRFLRWLSTNPFVFGTNTFVHYGSLRFCPNKIDIHISAIMFTYLGLSFSVVTSPSVSPCVVLSKCLSTASHSFTRAPLACITCLHLPRTRTRGWALGGSWQTPSELKGYTFSRPPALLLTDSCVSLRRLPVEAE